MTAPSRLVVLAPNWLGDAVMALPLLANLRRAWPGTRLTIAARPAIAPLFALVPGITDLITFETASGRRALGVWRNNIAMLRGGQFDAALLLPNSFGSAWLVSRAHIPQRWGFARDWRARLLTRAITRPSAHLHQAEYYQALGAGLGIAAGDRLATIVAADQDKSRATRLLRDAGVIPGERFVIFAPGAAYGRAKQWPPERFAQLAGLLGQEDISIVLVGSKNDAHACQQVMGLAARYARPGRGRAIDLSGRTDLATLAGLLSIAAAVVANDSGAMHLAAAVGVPVIAIFGPTDDRKTSPLRATADAPAPRILTTDVWCRPCMLRECPIDHRCMTGVSARAVFDSLRSSL